MKKYFPHRLMPLFVGVFLLLSLGGCATPDSPQDANVTDVVTTIEDNNMSELPTLQGQAVVQMTVNGSPITIEIDGNNAPITGGNFVDLVDKGFYDGLTFHRVVKEPQPFVAQGGDPEGTGTGGYVDPETNQPRNIPLEITPAGAESPLYSQTFQQAGMSAKPELQHTRGAIAMARSQMPDSASSQFYFTLADVSFLDGDYAVFGYVTEGMDVVEQINQGDTIDSVQVISGIENLSR